MKERNILFLIYMIGRQIPLEFVFQTLIIRTLMKKGYQSILNIFSGTNFQRKVDYGQWMFKAHDGQDMLSSLQHKDGGLVTFGDNNQCKVIGVGNVGQGKNPLIENVLLVDGLTHNLLSISQLCDKGYKVLFDKNACHLYDLDMTNVIAKGYRKDNIYMINITLKEVDNEALCK